MFLMPQSIHFLRICWWVGGLLSQDSLAYCMGTRLACELFQKLVSTFCMGKNNLDCSFFFTFIGQFASPYFNFLVFCMLQCFELKRKPRKNASLLLLYAGLKWKSCNVVTLINTKNGFCIHSMLRVFLTLRNLCVDIEKKALVDSGTAILEQSLFFINLRPPFFLHLDTSDFPLI